MSEALCQCGHPSRDHIRGGRLLPDVCTGNDTNSGDDCPCTAFTPPPTREPIRLTDQAEGEECAKCGFTRPEHAANPYRCTGFTRAEAEKAWREWDNGDHGWENCREAFLAGFRAARLAGGPTLADAWRQGAETVYEAWSEAEGPFFDDVESNFPNPHRTPESEDTE